MWSSWTAGRSTASARRADGTTTLRRATTMQVASPASTRSARPRRRRPSTQGPPSSTRRTRRRSTKSTSAGGVGGRPRSARARRSRALRQTRSSWTRRAMLAPTITASSGPPQLTGSSGLGREIFRAFTLSCKCKIRTISRTSTMRAWLQVGAATAIGWCVAFHPCGHAWFCR
jgi:hypothetical protein